MATASRLLPLRLLVALQYQARTGRQANLAQPKDFSEKLSASKLRRPSPLEVACADKIRVRDYVASTVGEKILIRKILHSYDVADLNPKAVTERRFVVKANHDSGTVFLCRERDKFDWPTTRYILSQRLAASFYYNAFEPQYRKIRPGFIVEELLSAPGGGDLPDYKLFCFSGEPTLVQVDLDRFTAHQRVFFDTAWNRLDAELRYPLRFADDIAPPRRLDEMIDYARALAAPFPFVRIDLYETVDGVKFGEITFRPEAGLCRFRPDRWERVLGDLLPDGPSPFGSVGARHSLPRGEDLVDKA